MDKLEVASPQPVEELRIQASFYENFLRFFQLWTRLLGEHAYDTDLIINVDETTTNAEKCKTTTKVIFDPSLDIRPMATITGKVEHVTMCSGISASGRSLMPMFIIKNKNVTVEDSLSGPLFDCGAYGIASSPNGWQDGVRYAYSSECNHDLAYSEPSSSGCFKSFFHIEGHSRRRRSPFFCFWMVTPRIHWKTASRFAKKTMLKCV